jgi:uncharacterized paraquat-inducible protein A
MRPIDADALIKKWENVQSKDISFAMAIIGAINDVKKAPTIDAVPVRHGKWIKWFEDADGQWMRCSECQMMFYVGKGRDGNYCPNCGSRMDKNETD